MKFWETHAEEMRKARLLHAAAVIYATDPHSGPYYADAAANAVDKALRLETVINKKLKEKKSER